MAGEHAAETRPGKRPPRWEAPHFPRQRPAHCPLTRGNVGGPHTAGNDGAETALVGWGARIRTSVWRNQNPQTPLIRKAFLPASCVCVAFGFRQTGGCQLTRCSPGGGKGGGHR